MVNRVGKFIVVMDISNPYNVAILCPVLNVATCGDSIQDAIRMAEEAIAMTLELLYMTSKSPFPIRIVET
jgi:predicted RNase H-like HicB family nuclease